MTTLATHPVDDPDQLDLLALVPDQTADAGSFREACRLDADANEGWVSVNRVRVVLDARFGEVNPRWYSAQWAAACGKSGFLDKTEVLERIDPKHSRGNGNKSTVLRRWRGWDS